ncbi:hypothetical protein Sjap_022210 [Stephania japonica]|uniref:Uncharacterized protein n=1 Tax=Stephania japonica TaxID=461633 RepID=A0AAP0EVR8_9MAGN
MNKTVRIYGSAAPNTPSPRTPHSINSHVPITCKCKYLIRQGGWGGQFISAAAPSPHFLSGSGCGIEDPQEEPPCALFSNISRHRLVRRLVVKMEVVTLGLQSSTDFNFDSGCSTPYLSAPSSPKRFGEHFYYSAPTSPTRASSVYQDHFNNNNTYVSSSSSSSSLIPFAWEEKPGKPKSNNDEGDEEEEEDEDEDDDFEFDFSGQFERASSTADELFDKGTIRPLKPPPAGLQLTFERSVIGSPTISSPKSPRSPKRMIRDAFSPRRTKDVIDPFEAAMERARLETEPLQQRVRGRERVSSSPSDRRGTRSLSPLRVSEYALSSEQQHQQQQQQQQATASTSNNSKAAAAAAATWKWSLKDLFLFRSASEGRAKDYYKDPLRKYAVLSRNNNNNNNNKHHREDVKNASFRSVDSTGSRRRGGGGASVSAHEMHYTANRAVAEEMKKKTFLPYKQGLFGCMGFNPAVQGFGRRFDL